MQFNKGYDMVSNYVTKSLLSFPLKSHRGYIVGVLQTINAKNKNGKIQAFSKKYEPLLMHFANTAAICGNLRGFLPNITSIFQLCFYRRLAGVGLNWYKV